MSKREDVHKYLHDTMRYFTILSVIFALSVVYGMYSYYNDPAEAGSIMAELGGMFEWIASLSLLEIMLLIFVNNTVKAFMAIVLGIFAGIFPLYFVAVNGYFIGIVVYDAIQKEGLLYVLAAILPHGIIELPVVLFAGAIGIRIGASAIQALAHGNGSFMSKHRYNTVWMELKRGVLFFWHILIPLLFIAALIETIVTPVVVSLII
ncbi:MAG: stage II sporulation protein M [Methanosarcinales archaeon]|nr:stage II sporulation protein M [Methanosarcinales archaeon]